MPVHLGDVDSHSGALLVYGLDFLEFAEPGPVVATAIPNVMVSRDAESWGLRVDQLRETSFAIHGERSSAPFKVWDQIAIRFGAGTSTRREEVGDVLSDSSCIVVLDPAIADQLRGPATTADVACWGSRAAHVAERLGLAQLGPDTYGYRDVPIETAPALEERLRVASLYGTRVATHERTPGYLLMRQLDASPSALMTLGSLRVLGFRAHQDGSWPVVAELADDGALVGLTISLAR